MLVLLTLPRQETGWKSLTLRILSFMPGKFRDVFKGQKSCSPLIFSSRKSVTIMNPGRGNGYLTLVKALDSWTWLLTFVFLLIGSFLASLTYYLSKFGFFGSNNPEAELMSFRESFYQSFVILCQQGKSKSDAGIIYFSSISQNFMLSRYVTRWHQINLYSNQLGLNSFLCGCLVC